MAKQTKFTPIDDEDFFAQSVELGFTTTHYADLVRLHQNGAEFLRNRLGASSVFEIGSGLGFFLTACNNIGLNAVGCDINKVEREFALSKGVKPEQYLISGVEDVKLNPVDVIYSTEVFEHVTDQMLAPLLKQIADNCKWFYFTSTPHKSTPAQDKRWGHINIKSKEGWVDLFEQYGIQYHTPSSVITDWGLIFRGNLR